MMLWTSLSFASSRTLCISFFATPFLIMTNMEINMVWTLKMMMLAKMKMMMMTRMKTIMVEFEDEC